MAIRDLLLNYINQVTTVVIQETQINSLDPDKIGSIGTDLAEILLGFLPTLSSAQINGGTALPNGGADGDLYFRSNGGNVTIYRNVDGTWGPLGSFPIGFTLADGKMVGLNVYIKDNIVTVTAGQWVVNGSPYDKAVQTQFNIPTAHNTLQRQDLIYAGAADDAIGYVIGTPGMGQPNTPANSIIVDVIIVPALSTLAKPYFVFNSFGVESTVSALTPEFIKSLPIYDTVAALEASNLVDYAPYRTSSGFLKYKAPEIGAMNNNTQISNDSLIA